MLLLSVSILFDTMWFIVTFLAIQETTLQDKIFQFNKVTEKCMYDTI